MDKKKLDKWADLLLDTGKRNNLINFKDTASMTVEVVYPSSDVLFEKAEGTASFEVYDPKLSDNDEEDEDDIIEPVPSEADSVEPDTSDDKASFVSENFAKIRRQNQILIYNSSKKPLDAVMKIDKKAREFIEETGVNVAYMAFGFIHWKEHESSNIEFRAPVLLLPIQLECASATDPYIIKSTDDDVIVNPTFSYLMDAEYNVKLPDYNSEGLCDYLEKVEHIVLKLGWSVTKECKVGIFSFLKINMYRDLKDNADAILSNQNVRRLLGEQDNSEVTDSYTEEELSVKNPLIELHSVVDADSSQIEAIEMAKSGKSFVLQGPPGTGKSQTITNIIAECLCDGKKVLFVSEKLAALNVVYEKLKQAGLEEFCLQLHSHKANKKDVIADICHTLRKGRSSVSSKADTEIAIKERANNQLDNYAFELHKERDVIKKSLYQLYELYASTRKMPTVEYVLPDISAKGIDYLNDTVLLLEQYVDYIPSIGYDYRKNVWYGYVNQDTSYQTKTTVKNDFVAILNMLRALMPIQQEINEKYNLQCINIEDAVSFSTLFSLLSTTQFITPALLKRDILDKVYQGIKILQALSIEILNDKDKLNIIFDEDIYKINGSEYYKKLTKQFNGFFSRLFNSEYKQIILSLRLCRKDGRKPSYDEAVASMEALSEYQRKTSEFAGTESSIKEYLGSGYNGIETDWNDVIEQMSTLENITTKNITFGSLENLENFDIIKEEFAKFHQKLDDALKISDSGTLTRVTGYYDASILNIQISPCVLLTERLNQCVDNIDKLDNWVHFRTLLTKLDENETIPYLHTAIGNNIDSRKIAGAFKRLFYRQWIDKILSENPTLAAFNRISQDKAINTFVEKDVEQFEINKAKIRAELSSNRPSLDMVASGSALAILLREGEKKRKQKSIRTLLTEAGELIQRIKPCFLMSPLSVSTFLASNSVHFDVVVFDEASQIFPQDAIGAIYRAEQLIVVGDSKQMPPSNFFNATIEAEDNDEETGDVTDFESILDLCSTSLQQLRLRWHYRSRYEQLIAFSNKNFYDSDLVTFPSAKADAHGIGVDYYHVDGIFDRKSHTNRKEAEYVVDLIYKNIEEYPNRSLGVVAFSVAQQDLIDKLLSKRRQATPEKEFFFKTDGEEPFFIKNLETVQGDERDTIIFSVAYGIDSQGRLLHNFGPLNRIGGERRLNVAVTRARHNVQLVSSMHHTDIDLKRTSAEGAKLLREYLDFAENGNIALERTISVNSFDQFDSDFELEVCEYLKYHGFDVDTQVGCSGFKIDLGLKIPNSSDYVLAIECDGATYHSSKNARDRDRLRQQILERMGWKFYRIWSTDWFRNKSVEQERLLEAATAAINNPSQSKVTVTPVRQQEPESFEEAQTVSHFEFPEYRAANIDSLENKYWPRNFKGMVREILEVEAPLSESLLLKRIVHLFGREKVTSVVQREYDRMMLGCQRQGIIRKNGFLYLDNDKDIVFRRSGNIVRDIKQIAPEELAAGMLEILKQNVTADKNGLFHSLALQCGVSRVGKAANKSLEEALCMLEGQIVIDGSQISVK